LFESGDGSDYQQLQTALQNFNLQPSDITQTYYTHARPFQQRRSAFTHLAQTNQAPATTSNVGDSSFDYTFNPKQMSGSLKSAAASELQVGHYFDRGAGLRHSRNQNSW
jgi:hypothetical protein